MEMLQCHPYPHEYVDTTKQCAHSAFFIGLQRKQGEKVEGEQFNIGGTVHEFRQSIEMYNFWKPGMKIYVSHVRRKHLPSYLFPDGCKQPRPTRVVAQQHDNDVNPTGPGERHLKRKNDLGGGSPPKRLSISPQRQDSVSPEIITHNAGSASPNSSSNSALCEADGENGNLFPNGSQEGLEVLDLSSFT